MTEQKSILRGYIYVIVSAVLFGCMPLMANHIYADGVDPMALVLLRNVISLPFIGAIGLFRRESFAVRPGRLLGIFAVGIIGCAITPLLLFSSYGYINGGVATVFHFIYPAVVLVLELFLLKSNPSRASIAAILLCIVGIALFYNPGAQINLVGSLLALCSGVTYAVYIFLLARFGKTGIGGYVFSFFSILGSSVILALACLLSGGIAFPSTAKGWLLCALFSILINVGAVMLFQGGTFIIGGRKAAVISTFEPITSLAVGYFAFGESVGILAILGAVLVLSASVITAIFDGEEED